MTEVDVFRFVSILLKREKGSSLSCFLQSFLFLKTNKQQKQWAHNKKKNNFFCKVTENYCFWNKIVWVFVILLIYFLQLQAHSP